MQSDHAWGADSEYIPSIAIQSLDEGVEGSDMQKAQDVALHAAAEASRHCPTRIIQSKEEVDYTSSTMEVDNIPASKLDSRPRTTTAASVEEDESCGKKDAPIGVEDTVFFSKNPSLDVQSPCRSEPASPSTLLQYDRAPRPFSSTSQGPLVHQAPDSPTPRFFRRNAQPTSSHKVSINNSMSLDDEERIPSKLQFVALAKPLRPRQRSSSVPPNVVLSPKSPAQRKPQTVSQFNESGLVAIKVLPPLSQHQLYTLHQLNLPRPALLTDVLGASRSWSTKRSSKLSSSIYGNAELSVPSTLPPITRSTLKELDLSEILRNPQLRHDIVFDSNLVFRPNFDGDRGFKKMLASERYWLAVTREISCGCRCTAFENGSTTPLSCVCRAAGSLTTVASCLLDRDAISQQTSSQKVILNAVPLATRLPSRIAPLVKELRGILLSLLPAATNSPFPGMSLADDHAARQHISQTLDPDLIAQEVEHGVLDVASLGRFLGQTLKMHCAPMRDDMVDSMVACIESSDAEGHEIARGLRMAFEILELMKLDIANHQLRTLRPYLLETALDFELRSYLEGNDRRQSTSMRKTLQWLAAASSRSASKAPAQIVREGLLELIFDPEINQVPTVTPRGKARKSRSLRSPSASVIPESLQLDTLRLQTLHSDVTDLTVVYMLLMLFNQVVAPVSIQAVDADTIRQEIWILLHSNGLVRAASGLPLRASSPAQESLPCLSSFSCSGKRKLQDRRFKEGLQDVLLRLAVRAKMLKLGLSVAADIPHGLLPDTITLDLMTHWTDVHLSTSSSLFNLLQKRLRVALDTMLKTTFSKHISGSRGWWITHSPPDSATTCLDSARTQLNPCSSRPFEASFLSLDKSQSPKRERDAEFGEEDDSERAKKRHRVGDPQEIHDTDQPLESLLRRSGLTALRSECEILAERIGRVGTFHYSAFQGLYACMLQQTELGSH